MEARKALFQEGGFEDSEVEGDVQEKETFSPVNCFPNLNTDGPG